MAFQENLNVTAVPCKQHHTDALAECLDSKTLWDEYGIDDDIIVCALWSQLSYLPQTL